MSTEKLRATIKVSWAFVQSLSGDRGYLWWLCYVQALQLVSGMPLKKAGEAQSLPTGGIHAQRTHVCACTHANRHAHMHTCKQACTQADAQTC